MTTPRPIFRADERDGWPEAVARVAILLALAASAGLMLWLLGCAAAMVWRAL